MDKTGSISHMIYPLHQMQPMYINKQNAFGVSTDGNKYGIFGTTLPELN